MIPTIEITDDGIIVPTRASIEAWLWSIMNEAFGPDLVQDARTPQGQLVTSLTAAIDDLNNKAVALGNQFDPRYATGVYQAALAAIYFLQRKLGTRSIAQLMLEGEIGTIVPAGFVVVDDANIRWTLKEDAEIGGALADAECELIGEIQAAANTINTPESALPGLDRVFNPAAAAIGSQEESRVAFEIRRSESVAQNSWGMNNSVFGAVYSLAGVIDCYVIDNPTDASITVGVTNYPMIRNSLLVSVVGGEDQDIAKQILTKGGTGCAFVGNTTVTYIDTESGNVDPPSYEIKFLRPVFIDLFIRVRVRSLGDVSQQTISEIKNAIISDFANGENRARIGGDIIPNAYMCGLPSSARIVDIVASRDGSSWHQKLSFGVDEFPVISEQNIMVVNA